MAWKPHRPDDVCLDVLGQWPRDELVRLLHGVYSGAVSLGQLRAEVDAALGGPRRD